MKTPICDLCLKTGLLCPGCQKRLSEGTLSKLDVDVAQMLYKINDTHNISEASFVRALDLGRVVLIITEGDVGILIGRGGSVVGQISSALGKKVRIVEYSGDIRKSITDIIMPARLLGINTVWKAGREIFKVRISRSDAFALPVDSGSLEGVIKSWTGKEVAIAFE